MTNVPSESPVHEGTAVAIMGGFDASAAGGGSPGGPRIVINGVAFWGGVGVVRKPAYHEREALGSRRGGELGS